MDGMQRSVSFELNGKAPFGLFNAVSSCMICSRHLPQMIPAVVLKDSKVHQIALLFAFKSLQAVKNANFLFC